EDVFLAAPLIWHGLRAESQAAGLGDRDPDAVARLVEHLRDLERRVPSVVPALRRTVVAYARMCRAELGRVQGASDPEAWRDVAERWSALLNPYPAAYAQLRRGEAPLHEARRARRPPGGGPPRPPGGWARRRSWPTSRRSPRAAASPSSTSSTAPGTCCWR